MSTTKTTKSINKHEVPMEWLFRKVYDFKPDMTNEAVKEHIKKLSNSGQITFKMSSWPIMSNTPTDTIKIILQEHYNDQILALIKNPKKDTYMLSIKHETGMLVLSNDTLCSLYQFYVSTRLMQNEIIELRVDLMKHIAQSILDSMNNIEGKKPLRMENDTPIAVVKNTEYLEETSIFLEALGLIEFKDNQWRFPTLNKFELTEGPNNKVVSHVQFQN